MNSISATGQCLIAPLVPCIQDSKSLYDCAEKTMFKLHSYLSLDILRDLQQRFDRTLILLRNIFLQASESKYFEGLIDVPQLPNRAPDFTLNQKIIQEPSSEPSSQESGQQPSQESSQELIII